MKKHGVILLLAILCVALFGLGLLAGCGSDGSGKTEYSITVAETENGTVSASASKAAEGTEITVTVTPDANYVLEEGSLRYNGTVIENNKFTMPAEKVTITATFVVAESPAAEYSITVAETENGTVSASASKAAEGTEITVTVTPDANYVLKEGSLRYNGTVIEDNKFTMPAENVTITAKFVGEEAVGITVTAPVKETYYLDEQAQELDLTGMEVTLDYASGNSVPVDLEDVTVSTVDLSVVNENILVTVSYEGFEDTFYIGVRQRTVSEDDLTATYYYNRTAEEDLSIEQSGVTGIVTLDGTTVSYTVGDGKVTVANSQLTAAQMILRVNKGSDYVFVKAIGETHISTVEDFKAIANDLSGYYVLDNSINFEGVYLEPFGTVPLYVTSDGTDGSNNIDTSGAGETPDSTGNFGQIGIPFTGTFDGNGYVLYNFKTGYESAAYAAGAFGRSLFGYIGETGVVKNVILRAYNIAGGQHSAFIAGLNLGTIENITIESTSSINSNYGLAHVVAAYNGGSIANVVCYVEKAQNSSGDIDFVEASDENFGSGTSVRVYIAPEGEVEELTALDGWKYIEGIGTICANDYYVFSRAESFEIPLGGELSLDLWFESAVSEDILVQIWDNAEIESGWDGENGVHVISFADGWSETEVGATFVVGVGTNAHGVSQWINVTVGEKVLTEVTFDGDQPLAWNKGTAVEGNESAFALTAHYSDGSTDSVVPDSVTGLDVDDESTQTVTLTYQGMSVQIQVTVAESAASLESLTLEGTAKNTVFYVGGSIALDDLTGLTLKANYSDGTSPTVPITLDMLSKTTFDAAGDPVEITITYGGKTAAFEVTVYEAPESITITVNQDVVTYPEGSAIDWSQYIEAEDNNGNPIKFENLSFGQDQVLNGEVAAKFVYTFNGEQTVESTEHTITFWYGIGTVEQWNAFAAKTGTTEEGFGGNYRLTADIDFAGVDFMPAAGTPSETPNGTAGFSGTFDGCGYSMSNILLASHNSAVFINLNGTGVIQNLVINGIQANGSGCAGLVIHNYGTVKDNLVINFYDISSWGAALVSNNTSFGTVSGCIADKVTFDNPTSNNFSLVKANIGKIENCLTVESNAANDVGAGKPDGTKTNVITIESFTDDGGDSVFAYADGNYTYTQGESLTVTFSDALWTLDEETKHLVLKKSDESSATSTVAEDFSSLDAWTIENRVWGYSGEQTHGGVITQNVCYDSDGNLVMIVNGDYYEGDKKGINSSYADVYGGKRTGAAIQSKQTFGYGSFEVEMTVPAFNGICTAVWLYNHFPNEAGGENHNYEIDIEVHGTAADEDGSLINSGNLRSVTCTSWLTETVYDSEVVDLNKALNDGNFHTFRFDWHSDRIEYYVDGALIYTSTECIPSNEMYFNIGCWFPNGWCGEPDFETDYITVKSFTYTAFEGEEAGTINSEDRTGNSSVDESVVLPERNYFANGSFAYDIAKNDAFQVAEGTYTYTAGSLAFEGKITQTVDMDCAGLSYLFRMQAEGEMTVTVYFQTFTGGVGEIGSMQIESGGRIQPPDGTTRMLFVFEGTGTLREISLTLA